MRQKIAHDSDNKRKTIRAVKGAYFIKPTDDYNMNDDKFSGKADVYDKFRPTYPAELSDLLYSKFITPRSTIADIGAGTGKFSKLLLERGNTVYCVEPNEDMMKIARETLCTYRGFMPVCASAESTTLPDDSIDLITAAQAFHWFDKTEFARECKRISKDKAVCSLIWNSYDTDDPTVKDLEKLNFDSLSKFKGFAGGSSPEKGVSDFFEKYETYRFVQSVIFDSDSFLGRCFSSSYSPAIQSEDGSRYRALLTNFFEKHSRDGMLSMPVKTICHVGRVK